MADQYTERDYYLYKADGATQYSTILKKWHGDLASFKFGTMDASKQDYPKYLKPRLVYLYHAADGRRRVLSVGDLTADIWTGVATTADLPDPHAAALVTFSVVNFRGQRLRVPHAIH